MDLTSLLAHAGAVIFLVAALLALSHVLGERSVSSRARSEPYESGQLPSRQAGGGGHVSFYVVALLFLLFDIEVLYLLAWAPVVSEVGWAGFVEVAIFSGVLLVLLAYLWRMGVLDWGSRLAQFLREGAEEDGP